MFLHSLAAELSPTSQAMSGRNEGKSRTSDRRPWQGSVVSSVCNASTFENVDLIQQILKTHSGYRPIETGRSKPGTQNWGMSVGYRSLKATSRQSSQSLLIAPPSSEHGDALKIQPHVTQSSRTHPPSCPLVAVNGDARLDGGGTAGRRAGAFGSAQPRCQSPPPCRPYVAHGRR